MIEIAKGASDTEIVAVVKNVVRESLHRRQPFMDRLQRNWDLYIGNHWLFDPPKGHEKVTLNYIGTLLDSLVSFFTGSNPEFEPWPMDGSHYSEDIAKISNRLMKSWWHRQGMVQDLDVSVRDTCIYGTNLFALDPPDMEDPYPDITTNIIDIFSCCFDLNVKHWDFQRGEYFAQVYLDDRRKMEKLFGKEIAPTTDHMDELRLYRHTDTPPTSSPRGSVVDHSYVDGSGAAVQMSESLDYPKTGYDPYDQCIVMRLYIRDNTMTKRKKTEVFTIDGQLQKVESEADEQEYPGGIRVLTVCGDTLCEDAASPFQKGYWRSKFPFIQSNFVKASKSPYGLGFPDRLEDIQMQLNKKTSLLYDWLSQLPKTPLIIPQGLGLDHGKISSRTGLILRPKNPLMSRYIRFLQTPAVSPAAVEAIRELLIHMERIGGIPDVSEGRRPTGVTAASAIIALQEKAKQKFSHQVRNLEGFLSNLGNGVLGGMEQYYIQPKPYYGFDDMGSPELLRYGGSAQISPALLLANGRHRVRVRAASTLEVSRYALEERYLQMYQMGIITDEQLVEGLDIPGKERIINDIKRRKMLEQLMAQADAVMGGGGGGGAPPPGGNGASRRLSSPTTERQQIGRAEGRERSKRVEAKIRG